jgi:Flp pilus assembly protein TadG
MTLRSHTRRRRRPRRPRGDQGVAVVEVAIAGTALVALLCLVILAGQVSELDADIQTASAAAARVASRQGTASGATHAAHHTATANLDDSQVSCGSLDVTTHADMRPGGTVTVTITCQADLSTLTPLAPAGLHRSLKATSTEVIDTRRGIGDP